MVDLPRPEPLAYSIADACALLSLGRTTIFAAIARGELKSKKVGRRTLIAAQDLKAWLDSCPAGTAAGATEAGHGA